MRLTPAVKTIIIINIVFYALTYWITPMVSLGGYTDWFMNFNSLHPVGSPGFAVYQYLTYMFMHGGWWHLFFNMWSLMIFGCAVEQALGTKCFWWYYVLSGIGAAVVHQALSLFGLVGNHGLVGASGAIYGVMAAAAYFFPNTRLFIIPIPFPIKLKYLVGFYVVIEMYMGLNSSDDVAHFAHLGGIFVGALLLVWWKNKQKRQSRRGDSYWTTSDSYSSSYNKGDADGGLLARLKSALGMKPKGPKIRIVETHPADPTPADHAYNAQRRRENEAIDAILDKIRKNGYQSLTDDEKAMLFQVSQRK